MKSRYKFQLVTKSCYNFERAVKSCFNFELARKGRTNFGTGKWQCKVNTILKLAAKRLHN